MERGLSILWIDAICGSVQNSMTPPEKNVVRVKRARGCFDALVSGGIGSVAELASLEGISGRL